ncbi:MAG: hypothetical protein P1U81_06865 [Verrucomicrobiales bacterium]|jgi:uncharacterized protein (TIGR02598 family)|nr:hypothetical protein [Verrucomicrobiales bacterium]
MKNRIRSVSLNEGAFSLVEVVLSVGIAAIALVSLLGMLPYAMESSRDGADQTAIGTVLEDVHDRIKGKILTPGEVDESPFFYDQQGRFWAEGIGGRVSGEVGTDRFFRVEIELRKAPATAPYRHTRDLHAAVVSIFWPIDKNGNPLGGDEPKSSLSYFLTTLTGPDWEAIDPMYQPKIEY